MSDNENEVTNEHDCTEFNDWVLDNSGLIGDLTERMSGCHHEAINALALALGRMCSIHDMELDDTVFGVIQEGFQLQEDINAEMAKEEGSEEVEALPEDPGANN